MQYSTTHVQTYTLANMYIDTMKYEYLCSHLYEYSKNIIHKNRGQNQYRSYSIRLLTQIP